MAGEHAIRPVVARDWPQVSEVFNHFVRTSSAAYPDAPVGPDFFRAWTQAAPAFPFLVVEVEGTVVGFGFLTPFHRAATMRRTASLTYFLQPEHTGRGIGSEVLERLMEEGRRLGVTNFLANISSENDGSLRFHLRHGFTECGRFRRIGSKLGREFDMVWVQKILEEPADVR